MHAGQLYKADRQRRRGRGPIADAVKATFDVFLKKHGLGTGSEPLSAAAFVRPTPPGGQMALFGG